MGYTTFYDVLIGNPNENPSHKEKNSKYNWHDKARLILKDGSVTTVGHCDKEGECVLERKEKAIIPIFGKKIKYVYTDDRFIDEDWVEGIFITDKTYKYLLKNKKFKKCTKGKNLYKLIEQFLKKKIKTQLEDYKYSQDCRLYDKNEYQDEDYNTYSKKDKLFFGYILEKDIWKFVNPDSKTKEGKKNKKRIEDIINKFVEFACKEKNINKNLKKNNRIISLKLIYKDVKSSKYWNIEYNNTDYKVHYGKTGTKGLTLSKKSSLDKIEKLIESKIKKGYKQKGKKKLLKKFSKINK